MEIRDILKNLREKNNLTQEQLAERVQVTRQAISRWETGETQPNTDTLKLLSRVFDVSINTLLGSPRQLVCQCCGMPLNEDGLISREPDGSYNEDYCKWCYIGGKFAYQSKESLLDYLVTNMPNPDNTDEETRRKQFDSYLSQLKHWKQLYFHGFQRIAKSVEPVNGQDERRIHAAVDSPARLCRQAIKGAVG